MAELTNNRARSLCISYLQGIKYQVYQRWSIKTNIECVDFHKQGWQH